MAASKSSVMRIKALGLHWRGPRLLAFEVYDHEGKLKGVRPLGDSVKFGKSAKQAVIRDFKEEIETDVSILAGSMVLENVFVHDGERRHEILFIFDLAFPEKAFESENRIRFQEDDGSWMTKAWYDPRELDVDGKPELYPKGLKSRLINR